MKLPIGYDDFGAIIENKLGYVDKTLMIKDFIDDKEALVSLITRPRRFGKTINMSMLQHFFAAEVNRRATAGLFDNLAISGCGQEYMQHQGKYPVIFISFKDVKDGNFETAYGQLLDLLRQAFSEHRYLLESSNLADDEKELFTAFLKKQADESSVSNALLILTQFLYLHFDVKPILLIDEYDTPIQSGYMHGYYEEIVGLMRHIFGVALKGNPNLHRAVLTGILRVSKESLFSGLNNLKVFSLFSNKYSEYFGFTEKEVSDVLKGMKLEHTAKEIKAWYNGYQIGDTVIYNPWSIANCISENGELQLYWVNTSGNELIKQSMQRSGAALKSDFEIILKGGAVEKVLPEYFVFGDLESDTSTLWSLMLEAGYLKAIEAEKVGAKTKCKLLPPNQEVDILFKDIVMSWISNPMGWETYHVFLRTLLEGNVTEFTLRLQDFLEASASHFDSGGKNPEKFYHGFVLGLISSLEKTHVVKSNRESGYGRYDVMIIPKDKTQKGVILEFKNARDEKNLHKAAEEALQQINDKNYEAELRKEGITSFIKFGLAFYGKKVVVLM